MTERACPVCGRVGTPHSPTGSVVACHEDDCPIMAWKHHLVDGGEGGGGGDVSDC